MTSGETKTGMAGWLKVVLIIALVLMLLVVLVFGAGYLFFKSTIKSDAAEIQQVADAMMTVKHPLSSDYKYEMAMDLSAAGTKLAALIHKPEDMTIIVSQITNNNKEITPEEVVAQFPKKTRSGKLNIDKKGTIDVGGKVMNFVSGKLRSQGSDTPVFVGTILVPDPKPHFFVVAATTDETAPLNQAAVDGFLNNIDTIK